MSLFFSLSERRTRAQRFFVCLSVCVLLLTAAACEKAGESNYLRYQDFPFALDAVVRLDGSEAGVSLTLTSADSMCVTFRSPESLEGITLRVLEGRASAVCRDTEIPLPESAAEYGIFQLLRLFTLENTWLTGVRVTEQSGVSVNEVSFALPETVPGTSGSVTVTLDGETGYPCRFVGSSGGHTVEIDVLSFTPLPVAETG